MRSPCKLILVPLFLAFATCSYSEDILMDDFQDGNRTAQIPALGSPPYVTVPWTASNPSMVAADSSALKISPYLSGSSAWTWAYFTPQGSPVSLDIGDQLRLSFKYTYNTNLPGVANLFRIGLFFTGTAPRQLSDGSAFNPPTLKGYTAQTDSQTARTNGTAIYAENNNGLAGAPFNTAGGGTYTKIGSDFDSIDAAATTRTGQMTIMRNASSVDVAVDLDTTGTGAKGTRTDTVLNLSAFDTIAFFHQSVGGNTRWVHLDDIRIEYLPAIATNVIVDEKFSDGNRDNQVPALGTPPYTSLPWLVSHAELTQTSSVLGLSMTLGNGFPRQAWSYFAPQNAPLTLAPGETIELSFDYQYTVDTSGQGSMLRFGLFNGGTNARALTSGTSPTPMRLAQDGLAGYEFEIDAQANTAKGVTASREINSGSDTLVFFGTLASLEPPYTSQDAGTVKRRAVMTIKNHEWKTDLTLNLDANTSGTAMVFSDVSAARLKTFDLAAFSNFYPTANAVTFSNILIKRVSGTPIPQPYPTAGGEGGKVFTVTSLADSGTGTLREALLQPMPRTIRFAQSGTIMLLAPIFVTTPFVTIDGATAPTGGITVLGDRINFKTHDVIMRHLRVRSGSKIQGPNSTGAAGGHTTDQRDSLQFNGNEAGDAPGYNYLVENCSVYWGVDENMEIYGKNSHDVVVRNCIFAEGLKNSIHWKTQGNTQSHSAGLIAGPQTSNIVIDGNLFAHNSFRNPALSGGTRAVVANNLIYNPGFAGLIIYADNTAGPTLLSAVSNVLIKGPSTQNSPLKTFSGLNPGSQLYFHNNTATGATAFDTAELPPGWSGPSPFIGTPPEPALLTKVNPLAPSDVEQAVIANAGARPWDRDAEDQRVINEVITRTGTIRDFPTDPNVSHLP